MMLSNELPRLTDASAAIASRFLVLQLRESFLGREDDALGERLLAELPGIFLWALEGLRRLRTSRRFTEPASGAEAKQDIADLASPVRAFVRDCCVVAAEASVEVGEVFAAYKRWCEDAGIDHPGTKPVFCRNLKAVCPGLPTKQRRRLGGVVRVVYGIRLADAHDEEGEEADLEPS
jgi:putative DNA primase/helicase